MTYKRLQRGDTEKFIQLLEVLKEAFEGEGYENPLPDNQYLSELLVREDYVILVAETDNKIVGGLIALHIKKWEQPRSEMFIYDLAVASEFRRQGIATGLINYLKEICKELGAYVIIVEADDGDEGPIALYGSMGTKIIAHHFDIEV